MSRHRQLYSAGLSIAGAHGTGGPGGPGRDRCHHKHRGRGGGRAGRGAAINGHTDVASVAADVGAGVDYASLGDSNVSSDLLTLLCDPLESLLNYPTGGLSGGGGGGSRTPSYFVF